MLSSQVKSSHRSSAMYLTPGGGDNDDSDAGCRPDDEGTISHAQVLTYMPQKELH